MPFKDPIKQKEYSRSYYLKNREKCIEYAKSNYFKNWEDRQKSRNEWLLNNPEKASSYKQKYTKKYLLDNPHKQTAHNAVQWALKKGRIVKPAECSRCLQKTPSKLLHAHHHKGYNEENRLNIVWICGSCHRKEHYEHYKKDMELTGR
jgi:hypothetical protein